MIRQQLHAVLVRTPAARTPQIAVSRGVSAQMVQTPTDGHAPSLRRRLAARIVLVLTDLLAVHIP